MQHPFDWTLRSSGVLKPPGAPLFRPPLMHAHTHTHICFVFGACKVIFVLVLLFFECWSCCRLLWFRSVIISFHWASCSWDSPILPTIQYHPMPNHPMPYHTTPYHTILYHSIQLACVFVQIAQDYGS